MNSTVFAKLPRFDTHLPPAQSHVSLVDDVPAPVLPDMSAINAAVAALQNATQGIEDKMREQVVDGVQSLASKLFPQLSDLFLAEEISRHLPALAPASAPNIEVRAEPELIEGIREAVERNQALAPRCTFLPINSAEDCRVHVSWESGGVTFDFDGLLDACLARMGSAPLDKGT